MISEPIHDSKADQLVDSLKTQGARIHSVRYLSNCNVEIYYSCPELKLNLEPKELYEL